jgi:hypothetical protein
VLFKIMSDPRYSKKSFPMFGTLRDPWYNVVRPFLRTRMMSRTYEAVRLRAKNQVLGRSEGEQLRTAGKPVANTPKSGFDRRILVDFRGPGFAAVRRSRRLAWGLSR